MPRRSRRRFSLLPLVAAVLCACSSAKPNTQSGAENAKEAGSAGTKTPTSTPATDAGGAGAPAQTRAGSAAPLQPSAAGTSAAPSAGQQATAAGSGGSGTAGTPAAGSGGSAAGSGAAGTSAPQAGADAVTQNFALTPVGAMMLGADEFAFPASALPPSNESPEFSWAGVPANAKSLALVFRDLSAGAVKWVIWDIPATRTGIPSHVSNLAMPAEVPGSSQLGSLGNQGYAGPCCMQNMYEWVLWALDVDKLPGAMGQTTVQLNNELLPKHKLATTKPIILRRTTR